MKLSIKVGATSQSVNVFIQDSSSTTGAGLTGLVFNTSGLTCYYALPRAAAVAVTLATLAAVTSAYSSGGFKEIDATNMPGWYRLDLPDAAIASGRFTNLHLKGATNMAPLPIEIELTGWDNQVAFSSVTISAVSGAVGSVTAGVNAIQLAGQTITAAAGVTFPTSVASPTNITAGTITTVTNLTNAPTAGDLTTTMAATVKTQVVNALSTDTYAEPAQGSPGATVSLASKINYLYKAWRNKVTQTSSTYSLFADDSSTVDHKATVSDDGTTLTRAKVATGP